MTLVHGLTFTVGPNGDKVRLDFSQSIAWAELDPEWARKLGEQMIRCADLIEGILGVPDSPLIVPGKLKS